MEPFLFTLTSIVNFICLALSLWLGFYIVSENPAEAAPTPPNSRAWEPGPLICG